jgi:hypothetical protein
MVGFAPADKIAVLVGTFIIDFALGSIFGLDFCLPAHGAFHCQAFFKSRYGFFDIIISLF